MRNRDVGSNREKVNRERDNNVGTICVSININKQM